MKILAVVLIVIGIISLGYQGIRYTKREKAVDLGPVEITTEQKKTIPLPPVVGGVALIAGLAILVTKRH